MADLDRLLRPDISLAAQDAAQPPDFTLIEGRGARLRRTRAAIAVAAAVVALLAVLGSRQLIGARQAVPASSPSTVTVSVTPRAMPSGDARVDPGTYRIPHSTSSAVDFTVTFPTGWRVQDGHIFHGNAGAPAETELQAFVVTEIYADACAGTAGAVKPAGASSADLVAALLAQSGTDATGPVATTIGGHPATRIDLRVPTGLNLRNCRSNEGGLQIWRAAADDYFVVLPGGTASVYALDIEGQRQVFITQYPPDASATDRTDLQTVLASIRFP